MKVSESISETLTPWQRRNIQHSKKIIFFKFVSINLSAAFLFNSRFSYNFFILRFIREKTFIFNSPTSQIAGLIKQNRLNNLFRFSLLNLTLLYVLGRQYSAVLNFEKSPSYKENIPIKIISGRELLHSMISYCKQRFGKIA